MIGVPSGISGTLFPDSYVAEQLESDTAAWHSSAAADRAHASYVRWWKSVAATCGPATGPRAVFDLIAMPLFGILGFRARDAVFDHRLTHVRLEPRQGVTVGLIVLPWAERPSVVWRDAVRVSHIAGAGWCFVLAPPFLSLVETRGCATRRSADFELDSLVDRRKFSTLHAVAGAGAFESCSADRGTDGTRLDILVQSASEFQDRVRNDLRDSMARALAALMGASRTGGAGRTNRAAAQRRAFDEALTLAYRLLFLLFAESRGLVPRDHAIYGPAYTVSALCRAALSTTPQPGLWEGLAAVTRLSRAGCTTRDLVVAPFNGRLFSRAAAPALERSPSRRPRRHEDDRDAALKEALVALGSRRGRAGRQQIDYRDLGVEQLGAVYERVLDLDPRTLGAVRSAQSATRHSRRRKQTGTFYTPQSLADFVVRRTLAPLVVGMPADRILDLRVLDPAMGSGAFLVAACRYLSSAYETALIDEGRATPADLDEDERACIRRLVAERCLVGVDRNPVAVQVARLSLWLTTLARGRPLGFLDHRLRVGDSLIGASPSDLRHVRVARRQACDHPLPLFDDDAFERVAECAVPPLTLLRLRPDDTVADVRAKETVWRRLLSNDSPLARWKTAANLWCARWFWPEGPSQAPRGAELRALLDAVLKNDVTLSGSSQAAKRLIAANRTATEHAFFHWPLEFTDVFYDDAGAAKADPGFDAVLGNPPWEMVRRDDAAGDTTAEEPARPADIVSFLRGSGIYPSCGSGHLNLYQPFVERALSLTRRDGRVGLVLPWGLATDDGSSQLRRLLLERSAVDTIIGIENSAGLFPIHRGVRFMVAVTTAGGATGDIRARFGIRTAAEIDSLPARDNGDLPSPYPVRLNRGTLARVGGPSMRIPDLRHTRDLGLATWLCDRFPAFGDPTGWHGLFGRELNVTEDRHAFGTSGLPVLEGKHIAPFRATVTGCRSRIERDRALALLPDARFDRPRLGYRDVAGVGNRLSLIAAVIPPHAVTTHTIFCLRTALPLATQHFICALFNSYVLNWLVRLLMGGHVTTSLVERLPVPVSPAPAAFRRIAHMSRRLADGSQSRLTEAVLQADVARLYGLDDTDFNAVLAAFPLVPSTERDRAAAAFKRLRSRSAAFPESGQEEQRDHGDGGRGDGPIAQSRGPEDEGHDDQRRHGGK